MASTNSTSFSYLSTTGNRFSGLASGMDIDSIVEKLMKAESAKMEKLQQQKQKYEWQRDAYRGINTKLEAFRTEALDKYTPSTFLAKSSSVSDSSRVSATATSSASGTLSISKVESLASTAQAIGNVQISGNNASGTNKLSELGITTDGTFKIKVFQKNGSPIEKSINYSASDSIDSLVSKLNKEGLGVTAMFGNGKLSLTSNVTGSHDGGTISVTDDNGELFNKLGFLSAGQTEGSIANGTDAKYTINGVERTSKTNTFKELGYEITLKDTFITSGQLALQNGNNPDNLVVTGSAVTISSSTDSDTIVNQVKSFIELYNGLIESMNSPIKEKIDYNYKPLTEAQKSAMSEDEIKKWEEKSKLGLLRNDKAISSVVSNMRSSIYAIGTDKDAKYNSLFNIGITTSATYTDGGKLVIDEEKLKAAIEANPEAVSDLFTRSAGTSGTNDKGGLVIQLRSIAKTGIDSIADKAGKDGAVDNTFTLGKTIKSVDDRIATWKTKLKAIEDRYFKQFSAMETAIQKANSQSSIFAQG